MSGNKVPDKVAKAGFTVTPSPNVDAPIVNEYPYTLECKVISWADGILIGEVVNQSADERILTDGKVDLAKLQPIVNQYIRKLTETCAAQAAGTSRAR